MIAAALVVLGRGPASASAARAARGAGVEVVMLGADASPGPRIGETLPPSAAPLLHRLGLGDLAGDGHLPSPGVVEAWAHADLVERDFMFGPFGCGWHLDRRAFDERLLREAVEKGVRLLPSARLRGLRRESTGWIVEAETEAGAIEVRGQFLLDGTGRAAWSAHRLHVERISSDRLVAVVGFMADWPSRDARTYLEAAEDGWWYAARLPHHGGVIAYMTDADLLAAHIAGAESLWRDRLSRTEHIAALAERGPSELRVVAANGARLTHPIAADWAAVGDAAASWDPLSSQGIALALEGGDRAGAAAAAALAGDERPLHEYAGWIAGEWSGYQTLYAQHYGDVRRWPESPFWRRRQ